MGFSYDEYIRQTAKKKNFWDNPDEKYKEKFIPDLLYKYWSFSGEHIEENLQKICNNEIWMPNAKRLNDPYEFQMISDHLNENERLAFREDILGRNSILSLCASYNNNLLWSHYSYGHSGLCIEFEARKKFFIIPVTYVAKQIDATSDIREWLKVKEKLANIDQTKWTADDWVKMRKIDRVMHYKYIDWQYENEYRIVSRNMKSSNENDGWKIENVFWDELGSVYGIYVKQIILGFNCSLQNEAKVKDIVNKHNYSVFMNEMIEHNFDDSIEDCIKKIDDYQGFITISKMCRVGNSLELRKRELEKERYFYK